MPPVLQIVQQQGTRPDRHQAVLTLTDKGWAPRLVSVEFPFALSDQDREDIRWYLEDYLEFADDPAPRIASRIEQRMETIGDELFRALFQASDDARDLWAALRPDLGNARIEVVAGLAAATTIPWELLRDPRTGARAALEARAFVRGPQPNAVPARIPARRRKAEKVRILLAICRPRGGEDVPFRSVAGRLAKGLTGGARDAFDLHVLRPPTFDQLAKVLRQARDDGVPFHIVHFDGHGIYADPVVLEGGGMSFLGGLRLDAGGSRPAPGQRGLLLFEDLDDPANAAFVDGFKLGGLLRETRVPVLILNACQSAFAEAPAEPATVAADRGTRETVEAYGSLAQAVLDAGTVGVVAMRYSVYVVTAAQFVAELYEALARGRTLGEAVGLARKHLHEKPERAVAFDPRPLQDWSVPVVWERQPLRLWPEVKKTRSPETRIVVDGAGLSEDAALDRDLPARPDIGFYGRDETLYAVDRGFDANRVVLLHAYAGAGKTATAVEFARWYRATGGVQGPVMFSSFERHLPLVRLLDKIGEAFPRLRMRNGREWDAITDANTRREVALEVLAQVSVLWVWDNVEPVAGFPAGTTSDWSAAEQRELLAFLRDATAPGMRTKFLLTSRREEHEWLGELPTRVAVPPMPMRERLQLAHALARRRGVNPAKLPDLRPLLRFTDGNPLTILVTVGQGLREGIDTKERLGAYVAKLGAGAQEFTDVAEGRDKNLAASLSYGFGNAFLEDEQRALSLLHLFHGFVTVLALCLMVAPDVEWCIASLRGWTPDRCKALLDRAADVGLLSVHAGGSFGYYRIHPALPWFFRRLFARFYPDEEAPRARNAFAHAISSIGNEWANKYEDGDRVVLGPLSVEEDNLRTAWAVAREQGLWDVVVPAMQALRVLYSATGRLGAWRQLIEAAMPDFVDAETDGPLPGREEPWSFLVEYRIRLAMEDRQWSQAERFARLNVEWHRRAIAPILAANPEAWDDVQRNRVHNLAVLLGMLGVARVEQQDPGCVANFEEALRLYQQLGEGLGQAICASNLGQAHLTISALHNLDAAERWYRRSLELRPSGDYLGRATGMAHLVQVALERFQQADRTGQPQDELRRHLSAAVSYCHQALNLLPETASRELSIVQHQLGEIYFNAREDDRALHHFQQSIHYAEVSSDLYSAGKTRYAVAAMLLEDGRMPDARAYAEAALDNFREFGDRASDQVRKAEALLAEIDAAITKGDQQ
jgi:tetratricopeptide (TPR) repeat protein